MLTARILSLMELLMKAKLPTLFAAAFAATTALAQAPAVTTALIMSASGPLAVKASPTMIRLARIREGSSQAVMAAKVMRRGERRGAV